MKNNKYKLALKHTDKFKSVKPIETKEEAQEIGRKMAEKATKKLKLNLDVESTQQEG